MQLIPSLDLMQGRLVRLRHGDPKQATFYDLDPEDWIGSLVEAGSISCLTSATALLPQNQTPSSYWL